MAKYCISSFRFPKCTNSTNPARPCSPKRQIQPYGDSINVAAGLQVACHVLPQVRDQGDVGWPRITVIERVVTIVVIGVVWVLAELKLGWNIKDGRFRRETLLADGSGNAWGVFDDVEDAADANAGGELENALSFVRRGMSMAAAGCEYNLRGPDQLDYLTIRRESTINHSTAQHSIA